MNRKGKICIGVDEYKVINKTRVAEWNNGYPIGCAVGSNDYTNESEEDTGEFYFNNTYTNQ